MTSGFGAVIDTVGAVVSMVSVVTDEAGPAFPAASVKTAETLQVPSVNPVMTHEPLDEVTVAVQVMLVEPDVAVKVSEPVASGVVAETVTVVRFVFESLALTPASEPDANVGDADALGAVRSIVRVELTDAMVGPELPARSDTINALSVRVTVPAEHPDVVTVIVVPDEAGGFTEHPVAVPPMVKSVSESPVIDSLNVRVKVGDDALVGVVFGVNDDTDGTVTSRVTVVADTAAAGPVLPSESFTMPALRLRITVPAEQLVNETVTDVPDAALGVPTTHPVAVPVT